MGDLADYLIQHDSEFRKARLPALYSDFRRQKSLNPDGYRANVCTWQRALAHLASNGLLSPHSSSSNLLVVKVDTSLLQILEHRQYGQPLALGTAICEAVAGQDLVPLHDFLHSSRITFQRSWVTMPKEVINWTLRLLGIIDTVPEDKLPLGHYVIMSNVEIVSKALAQRMEGGISRLSRVFTKAHFQKEFRSNLVANQQLSELDINVLLTFLSRDLKMIGYDGQTIHFTGAGERKEVTEEDAAMASIKELMASLRHQIQLLNSRVDQIGPEVKSAIARKNRLVALALLKSKKLAESTLATRYASLGQLEEIAAKIEQASGQDQLVKIMESSARVLQNLNARIGGAERVSSVVDCLREQMSETDELSAIMADSMSVSVNEQEIDEELEALETEERIQQDKIQQQQQERNNDAEAEAVLHTLDSLPPIPVDLDEIRIPASGAGMEQVPQERG